MEKCLCKRVMGGSKVAWIREGRASNSGCQYICFHVTSFPACFRRMAFARTMVASCVIWQCALGSQVTLLATSPAFVYVAHRLHCCQCLITITHRPPHQPCLFVQHLHNNMFKRYLLGQGCINQANEGVIFISKSHGEDYYYDFLGH